jgi:hypothetical protein
MGQGGNGCLRAKSRILAVLCTCPEITWYFCHQFTSDLPTKMQSYYWTSALRTKHIRLRIGDTQKQNFGTIDETSPPGRSCRSYGGNINCYTCYALYCQAPTYVMTVRQLFSLLCTCSYITSHFGIEIRRKTATKI